MTPKALLTLVLAACASVARPSEPADTLELTDLCDPVSTLTYHVRLQASRNKPLAFDVFWNRTDSIHYRRARIEASPVAEADGTGRNVCTYTLIRRDGADEIVETTGEGLFTYATDRNNGFSAVLNVDSSGASLACGGASPEIDIDIEFDNETPGALGISRQRKTGVISNTIISKHRKPITRSAFETEEDIAAHIAASDDRLEALWSYLDRNTEPKHAVLADEYRIATVADGAGGYDIVLLEGPWQNRTVPPLHVKGKLLRTPFIDHFDLEWIDAHGNSLTHDTSADFELDGAVLKLNFPLLKSTVRFRRQTASR